jgi:hypothetical protein
MKRTAIVHCLSGLAGLALLLPGALGAAQLEPPSPPTSQSIRYEIHFISLHAAEVLAWDQCAQKEKCRIATATQVGGRGFLEVGAEPAVQEKVARALAKADASPGTQRFQLLLLSATLKAGGGAGPEIPANAEKALAELKKFLPFKSYQIVDGAWLSATEGEVAQGRLAASGGGTYSVSLRFRGAADPNAPALFMDHFELSQDVVLPTKDGPHYDKRRLIETTFSLKEGETVVVGTSKADGGDGALVVLLTAIPAA